MKAFMRISKSRLENWIEFELLKISVSIGKVGNDCKWKKFISRILNYKNQMENDDNFFGRS